MSVIATVINKFTPEYLHPLEIQLIAQFAETIPVNNVKFIIHRQKTSIRHISFIKFQSHPQFTGTMTDSDSRLSYSSPTSTVDQTLNLQSLTNYTFKT
jgi:hypothetical protein